VRPVAALWLAALWLAVVLTVVLTVVLAAGCGGDEHSPGEIVGPGRASSVAETSLLVQREAARSLGRSEPGSEKRILFGDLHVHSTYSIDAFVFALPLFGGEGARPPADACDFARYCAGVDFFSMNDHAEGLTPERWRATIESVRECNARAGDPASPDLVAFMGYEWTQAGATPETHYGHKNVIFRGLSDDELPARPITSLPDGTMGRARGIGAMGVFEALPRVGGEYADFLWLVRRMAETPDCERGVHSRQLPDDCRENAATPAELFRKLRQWGLDPLVIPHGLAWGIHAPPGARLDNQLTQANHDAERQRLLEVYSGHGNSEEFRARPDLTRDLSVCPEPTAEHLACCWRAGEIVRSRCGDAPAAECEARVARARELALEAGVAPHLVLPDTRPEDWLDCDQCRDCFKPAMNLRPGETAQYAIALSSFHEPGKDEPGKDEPGNDELDGAGAARRFRFGFIASSDNHGSRPGTGYKQYARREMTDARGMASPFFDRLTRWWVWGRQRDPSQAQPAPQSQERGLRGLLDVEREGSFMYPGGLVAVHSRGRDRDAIFDALEAREVYGTSGPRILLWFDLLNGPAGPVPMGAAVQMTGTPRFEVRAAGSFVQQPGCSQESRSALGAERLELLCRGECYRPGDERRRIARIEVIRVRPQMRPGELVAGLIEDPWRVLPCPADPAACTVHFEDPDFTRDSVYYVRALEEPSPAINGANLRTRFDAKGNALRTDPCFGSYRTAPDDDCLAPVKERAWSSPIFVDRLR
jgi:hypothetical protein